MCVGVDVEGGKERKRWGKMEGKIMITYVHDVGLWFDE